MNVGGCVACRGCGLAHRLVLLAMLGLLLLSGCAGGPKVILPELQTTIDRKLAAAELSVETCSHRLSHYGAWVAREIRFVLESAHAGQPTAEGPAPGRLPSCPGLSGLR